ncbi:MAG: trypsin-like peptidase domain-containing protein [Symploca sp. SIO2D2]|nr:trypsin-like peptidase domain-containing protein [Symploca sp. SIO2D2]
MLILVIAQAFNQQGFSQNNGSKPLNSPYSLINSEQLCQIAQQITVKITGRESWGSGVIVLKNEHTYTIVTTAHILKQDESQYTIETQDGQSYQGLLISRFDNNKTDGYDLAVLQFQSLQHSYQVANLVQWQQLEQVMAGGFPQDTQKFFCTKLGQVSLQLEQSMEEGYQLGYFLDTRKGMSGCPILNQQGQVVGIHGWGEPLIFINHDLYLYRDGSRVSQSLNIPPEEALDLLSASGWAIPAEILPILYPDLVNFQDN